MLMKKSTRFEVFKRDSFTCQYCGRAAPDVVLEVDHIHPRAEGGDDDLLNLVTSCEECNRGKSARLLSDDTAVQKRKHQLDLLQERRDQLEMLMDWHRSLIDLDGQALDETAEFWCDLVPGYSLNDSGMDSLKKYIKRFGLNEVLEAMRISTGQYLEFDPEAEDQTKPIHESVEKAFKFVPRICTVRKQEKDKPQLKDLYYIRGILRKRITYVNQWQSMQLMQAALQAGKSTEEIKQLALSVRNWTQFRTTMEEWAPSEE